MIQIYVLRQVKVRMLGAINLVTLGFHQLQIKLKTVFLIHMSEQYYIWGMKFQTYQNYMGI